MMRLSEISRHTVEPMSESPVSSTTFHPRRDPNFLLQSSARSAQSDFVGACAKFVPTQRFNETTRRM